MYPGFHTDDYFDFGLAASNYENTLSLNFSALSTYEISHFVLRPISFLNLLYNYNFYGINSLAMKIAVIPIHIIFVCLFYYLLNLLCNFLKLSFNPSIALVISLLLSFHPNNFWWIYWICNQNELLMMLFYTLALIFILKYISEDKKKYLWLYLISFLLSIAAKQQAIHLPVLIIFFSWVFKSKLSDEKYRIILKFSFVALIFSVVLSAVTYLLFSVDSFQLEYILKKPFSLFGNLLFVVFPFRSISVYNFFLNNKIYAVAAMLLIASVLVLFVRRNNNLKTIISIAVFTLITFYPRIFETANNRINSIQVLFFCMAFYFVIERWKMNKKLVPSVILVLILLNIVEAKNVSDYYKSINEKLQSEVYEYISSDFSSESIVAASYLPHIFPFELFYIKNKKFGYEDVNLIPIGYSHDFLKDNYQATVQAQLIKAGVQNDTLIISTESDNVNLYKEGLYKKKFKEFENINTSKSSEVKFILGILNPNKRKLIYYDGIKWGTVVR